MLRDLQARLGASLLEDFKTSPPSDLVAGDPARAAARFMIHRGNVLESLVNALGHTYPVLKTICGESNFRVLAGSFVRAHPPARPELMVYGG
ncbi:MAG: DNA-binding domain-containing protein, partial [Alphaproteobacteria bacterium]